MVTNPPHVAGHGPKILLRSAWQTVNIGDIAHTPGLLALLERHLPEAQVYLWPTRVTDGVDAMLHRRFPQLQILRDATAIRTAMQTCDFFLHGSGPSLVAAEDMARWARETGKPYGVYGITLSGPLPDAQLELLRRASFLFLRDSVSLAAARAMDIQCPIMEFAPDAAFAADLRHDAAATTFLQTHGLVEGKFLCCIPRLRYTPYWLIKPNAPFDAMRHQFNLEMQDHDHAPLREAIVRVVRETGFKILLCPEDQSQIAVGRENILAKLPEDVRASVVWRSRFWLTDEAISTYIRSAGLFGNEMHSPILCIGHGIPALVCRFAQQTSKGFMWRDIGLEPWLFDHDHPGDAERIVAAVLSLANDPGAARQLAAQGRAFVEKRQRESLEIVKQSLPA